MNFRTFLKVNGIYADFNGVLYFKRKRNEYGMFGLNEDAVKSDNAQKEEQFCLPYVSANGSNFLSETETNEVKRIIKHYLNKFQNEVKSLEEHPNEVTIKSKDIFIDLSFGVLNRRENEQLCTKEIASDNGKTKSIKLTPNELSSNIAKMISDYLDNVRSMQIEMYENFVAYSFEAYIFGINNYLDDSRHFSNEINKNGIKVYFKFDIRRNNQYWQDKDFSDRSLEIRDKTQKKQTFKVSELKNTKLVGISIHLSENN